MCKTKLVDDLKKFYNYPVIINDGIYSYEKEIYSYKDSDGDNPKYDTDALISGYISVTPFSFE